MCEGVAEAAQATSLLFPVFLNKSYAVDYTELPRAGYISTAVQNLNQALVILP